MTKYQITGDDIFFISIAHILYTIGRIKPNEKNSLSTRLFLMFV